MKTPILIPRVNANDESAILVKWHLPHRGPVQTGAPLADIETSKAVMTIEAERNGWLWRAASEGAELPVGASLGIITDDPSEFTQLESSGGTAPSDNAKREPEADASPTRFSPKAAALAAELGLSMERLGEAQLGLVTTAGLRAWAQAQAGGAANLRTEAAADGSERSERPSGVKAAEIKALQSGAEALRSSLTIYFDSETIRASSPRYGILPVLLQAIASTLSQHRKLLSFYAAGQIHYYESVHLGVAIDRGEGLRVVTLRNADQLSVAQLAVQLAKLSNDYLEKRLSPEDVQGSGFTVTDLSSLDILHFEPLMNHRQAAVLGVGGDSLLPKHPMSLTVGFDHRVLSGREVGEFLRNLRRRLLAAR